MIFIQTFLKTIWASVIALGALKVILAIIIIGVLSRVNAILGLVGTLLFLAYLLHWL